MQDETEIISNFLRVSGAYLFSCAYRESLRAAYARHAAEDAIAEHERRFRELLVCEAVCLVRTQADRIRPEVSRVKPLDCH
jgi:hypothetical protein